MNGNEVTTADMESLYYPMAITSTNINLFTYDGCLKLEDALEQYKIWDESYGYNIKKAWINEMEDGKIVCKYEVEKKYAIKKKVSADSYEQ